MSREYGPPRRSLADALGEHRLGDRPSRGGRAARRLVQLQLRVARRKLSLTRAIDAFVVATSLQFDAAVIATGDPDDIRRLASPLRHVRVFAL